MSRAGTLTWRTLERGKRWRDKTGRFKVEQRVGGDYGPTPVYMLTVAGACATVPAGGGMQGYFKGLHPSPDAAKAAAEAIA
jgi:hypothetical protein